MLHPPNCDQLHHLPWVLILGWNNISLEAAASPPVPPMVTLSFQRSEVKKDKSYNLFSTGPLAAAVT